MTDTVTPDFAPRKLPLWRTVGLAYRAPLRHLSAAVRISWLPLLLMVLSTFALSWLTWSWTGLWAGVAGWLETILQLPFLSSIAVAWHRLLLRGQQVTSRVYLRMDRVVVLYVLIGLLLTSLWQIWIFPLAYTPAETDIADDARLYLASVLAAIVVAVIFALISARLALVLPAIAVEKRVVGWRRIWNATRNNTWRLGFGGMLCAAPPLLLGGAVSLIFFSEETAQNAPFIVAQQTAFSLLIGIFVLVGVGFLSFAYRWFFEPTGFTPSRA